MEHSCFYCNISQRGRCKDLKEAQECADYKDKLALLEKVKKSAEVPKNEMHIVTSVEATLPSGTQIKVYTPFHGDDQKVAVEHGSGLSGFTALYDAEDIDIITQVLKKISQSKG